MFELSAWVRSLSHTLEQARPVNGINCLQLIGYCTITRRKRVVDVGVSTAEHSRLGVDTRLLPYSITPTSLAWFETQWGGLVLGQYLVL